VDWIEIACGRAYDGMNFLFPKKPQVSSLKE
jgi:hypothetical protein